MSTASNTSQKFQLARKVIGFHWPMLSANQSAQILSSFFKTVASVLGNEKSIKSILISCAAIPSITNTYSNGVIELIFGILDSTKSKTDTTEPLCTTCIRKIPNLLYEVSLLPKKYQFAANSDILLTSFDIFGIFKKCIDTFGRKRFITNERKNQFRNIVSVDLHKSFRTVLAFWFDSQSAR